MWMYGWKLMCKCGGGCNGGGWCVGVMVGGGVWM